MMRTMKVAAVGAGLAAAGVVRLPMHYHERSFDEVAESIRARTKMAEQLQSSEGSPPHSGAIQNFQDSAYTGTATVGGQSFSVIYDTGSSDLWVPGPKVTTPGKHIYDHTKSKNYVANGRPFNLAYGSGPVNGMLSEDEVSFMDLKLEKYTFMEVTNVAGLGQLYASSPMDGILGLGFSAIANGLKAPIDVLKANGALSEPVFAFYLTGGEKSGSELIFGGLDKAHYSGDFKYVDLQAETYWQVNLKDLKVGDASVMGVLHTGSAIVDSGTSLLAGPSGDVAAIMQKWGAQQTQQGLFAVDCSTAKTLPDLTFTIGGSWFAAGTDFSLSAMDCVFHQEAGKCLFGIAPGPAGQWILGDVFMRKYYVAFDFGKNRMGFAQSTGYMGSSSVNTSSSPADIIV